MKAALVLFRNIFAVILGVGLFYVISLPLKHDFGFPALYEAYEWHSRYIFQFFWLFRYGTLVIFCRLSLALAYIVTDRRFRNRHVILLCTLGICAIVTLGLIYRIPVTVGPFLSYISYIITILICGYLAWDRSQERFDEYQNKPNEKDKTK